MDKIKTGDLLIWNEPPKKGLSKLVSKTIRIFSKSIYTHVAVAIVEDEKVYAVEAIYPRVRKTLVKDTENFFVVQTNLEIEEEHLTLLSNEIGKKLSAFQTLFSLINIFEKTNYWVCVKLANYFYIKIMKLDICESFTPTEICMNLMGISEDNTQRLIKGKIC